MNNLPSDKRNKIVLVGIATLFVAVLLGVFVIRPQYAALTENAAKLEGAQNQLATSQRMAQQSKQIEHNLDEVANRLRGVEDTMATGDMYSWIIKTLSGFQATYHVEIPNFNQPTVGEVGIFPKFPYQSATFAIRGTAFYHDFGRFLADIENSFPTARVQNLDLEPIGTMAANPQEAEKVSFKMEIVALIKPNNSL